MRQLTIRITDPELERCVTELAKTERLSLNQAALRVLRKGAGIGAGARNRGVGESLDAFFGCWSEDQAREIEAAVQVFESVDEAFWT